MYDAPSTGSGETLKCLTDTGGFGEQLDDFADAQGINDLMFDASFDRSKAYFSALQLLRLVDERANESITSLEPIIERVSRFASDADDELAYFLGIKAHMESHVEKICRQTKAKSEAIESLRDGVSHDHLEHVYLFSFFFFLKKKRNADSLSTNAYSYSTLRHFVRQLEQ